MKLNGINLTECELHGNLFIKNVGQQPKSLVLAPPGNKVGLEKMLWLKDEGLVYFKFKTATGVPTHRFIPITSVFAMSVDESEFKKDEV